MSIKQTPRGGAVFRLDRHLKRLLRSCSLMGLPMAYEEEVLAKAILETIRANPGARNVKISAVHSFHRGGCRAGRPASLGGHCGLRSGLWTFSPAFRVRVEPGLPLCVSVSKENTRQRREDIISPEAKVSANYVSSMVAKARALKAGFHEDPASG